MMSNILYVDDNAEYRTLVVEILKQKIKVAPQVAGSAQEAIALMQGQTFTLVISDYDMPMASGYEVFRFITQYDLSTLFVLFTAHPIDAELAAKFTGERFAGFVENKNIVDLVIKIISVLQIQIRG